MSESLKKTPKSRGQKTTKDIFAGSSKQDFSKKGHRVSIHEESSTEEMEVDKPLSQNDEAKSEDNDASQDLEDEDQRHLLFLDQKRYMVLIIVGIATAIMELGLLTIINLRRPDPSSRDKGAFYYVFFR